MIEAIVALAAALYTARLAVREADRVAAAAGLVPPAPPRAGLAPPPAIPVVRAQPDPDRLIQTVAEVPAGRRAAASALGRLIAGVAALGLLLALSILGAVRGIDLVLRKLSGG